MQGIKQQVKQYVLDNFIMGASPGDLRDDDSFMSRHIIDSTGIIELVTFLEESFGIRIAEEEMLPDNLDSLNSIERYVQRKLDGASK